MFRKAKSIPRVQLTTQLSVFAVIILLVVLLAAYFVVAYSERVSSYHQAEALADTAIAHILAGEAVPRGTAWLLPQPGPPSAATFPKEIQGLPVGQSRIRIDGRPMSAVVRSLGGDRRAVVLYNEEPHKKRLWEVARLLAAIGAFLLVAALVFSSYWARNLLRDDARFRNRASQQLRAAVVRALSDKDETSSTLARTYTEYVRLLYDPDERTREFIANVGHELRTPITLVRTGCEVLTTIPDLSDRHQIRIAQMISALDYINETVRSFMILAREGDFGPANQVRIANVIADVIDLNAAEARVRGVEFEVNVAEAAEAEVNRDALMIALGNLVRNAIRHAEGPGRISISYEAGCISVADSGPGIATEDRSRIFMPFYRARRAAEEGRFGHGLGLAIVKRVSDFYGWKIDVTSRHGQGTVFKILIEDR